MVNFIRSPLSYIANTFEDRNQSLERKTLSATW